MMALSSFSVARATVRVQRGDYAWCVRFDSIAYIRSLSSNAVIWTMLTPNPVAENSLCTGGHNCSVVRLDSGAIGSTIRRDPARQPYLDYSNEIRRVIFLLTVCLVGHSRQLEAVEIASSVSSACLDEVQTLLCKNGNSHPHITE